MEGKEKNSDGNGLKWAQRIQNDLPKGLPPQLSTTELRQLTPSSSLPHSSLSGDDNALQGVLQSEGVNEFPPPTSPGNLKKRRSTNAANREKIWQKMNTTSSDSNPKKRNFGILEFAGEMYEGNERKNENRTENEHGSDENGNHYMQSENESVLHKKPETGLL